MARRWYVEGTRVRVHEVGLLVQAHALGPTAAALGVLSTVNAPLQSAIRAPRSLQALDFGGGSAQAGSQSRCPPEVAGRAWAVRSRLPGALTGLWSDPGPH